MIRNNNTIEGVLDKYTGEPITYNKVTTYTTDSGSTFAIGDAQCDGVMYRKVGSEYFERNITNGIVNLAWYGVLGNGTDEHDKIQKAIYASYNRTLWIPKGTFHTTKLEGINNIIIDGVGTLKAHSTIPLYDPTILFLGKSNFKIKNITFDGNKGVVAGNDQQGSANIIISNCNDAEINGIKVNNNAYVAIAIYNSNRIKTNNSKFLNTDCGVIHNGGDTWECIGNYAEAGTSDAFVAWGASNNFCTNVSMKNNSVKDKIIAYEFRYVNGYDVSGNFANNCTVGVSSQAMNGIAFNGKIINNTIATCSIGISGVFNNTIIQSNTISRCIYSAITIGVIELDGEGLASGRSDLVSTNVITSKNILIDNVTDSNRGWAIVYSNVKSGEIDSNIVKDTKTTVLTNNPIFLASICDSIKISNNQTQGYVEGSDIKIQSSVTNSQIYGNNGVVDNTGTLTPILYKTQVAGIAATNSDQFVIKSQIDAKQAVASTDTAVVAAGANPTKVEFDALLAELHDLKAKMRTATLLAST